MAYIGWDNREYEDSEMDAMKEDAREDQKHWRNILKKFIVLLEDYDRQRNTCYAAYLNESVDTFSDDFPYIASMLQSAVQTTSLEQEPPDNFNPFLDTDDL